MTCDIKGNTNGRIEKGLLEVIFHGYAVAKAMAAQVGSPGGFLFWKRKAPESTNDCRTDFERRYIDKGY